MDASFEYRLEKGEHAQGLKAMRRLLAIPDVKFSASIFLSLLFALLVIEWRIPGSVFWMVLGIGLYCIAYGTWLARQTKGAFDPARDGYEVEFRDDAIVQRSKIAEHHWPLGALRRVEELRDVVLLQFAGWDWIVLPNHLWLDAGKRSEFATELRQGAPNIVPPLKWVSIGIPGFLVAGGVAAGLNTALLSHGLLYLLGIDMCNCAVRHSFLGRVISPVMVIGALILMPYAILGLGRLRARRPRLSSTIAAILILPQAVLGIWVALRFLRFL